MTDPQSDEDAAISALRDAVLSIEKELGISPSGVYSDVRARLDILEARIKNINTVIPDGYIFSPLYIINESIYHPNNNLSISDGYGNPNVIMAPGTEGSIYLDYNPDNSNKLYVNSNGAWENVLTESSAFTAAGDLTGDNTTQIVGQRKTFMFMGC